MIFLLMIDTPEDKRKFVILYEKYRYLMHKVAMDVLHDCFSAEDAVQNAFVNLVMHMDDIGDPESLQTKRYLITIVKNAAVDIYRKKNVRMQREAYIDELKEEDMPVSYMETDIENEVLDILKNLPIKYRDVFLLKYSAHLENSEIARLCGIQEGTVRQRIARGKILIEEALEGLEEDTREENKRNR
nr:RNA polymerase sigma factor [uncultured Acetatifactor sp.]